MLGYNFGFLKKLWYKPKYHECSYTTKAVMISFICEICCHVHSSLTKTSWWHHQMEVFSALLVFCAGNSPVNSRWKGQWLGGLMFSLICGWDKNWVNDGDAGGLISHRADYDIIIMLCKCGIASLGNCWYVKVCQCESFILQASGQVRLT